MRFPSQPASITTEDLLAATGNLAEFGHLMWFGTAGTQVITCTSAITACGRDSWRPVLAPGGEARNSGLLIETYIYIHIKIYMHMKICIYIYIHLHICIYIYMFIYVSICMYIYSYIHTYLVSERCRRFATSCFGNGHAQSSDLALWDLGNLLVEATSSQKAGNQQAIRSFSRESSKTAV